MKINKFDVESELAVDENGNVTGWFETPAVPHVRYAISFHVDEVATPEVEEIDMLCEDGECNAYRDEDGNCTIEGCDSAAETVDVNQATGEPNQVSGAPVSDINAPNPGGIPQEPPETS